MKNFDGLEEAEWYLTKALAIDDKNPAVLTSLGRVKEKKEDIDGAISLYERAIKQTQSNVQPFFYLGVIYEKLKEEEKAIFMFKQCIKIDNKHVGACMHYGTILSNSKDRELNRKALKYFKKVYSENLNPVGKYAYAKVLHKLGEDLEKAESMFLELIEEEPNNYKALC